MAFSEENKALIKVLRQERVMERNSLSKTLRKLRYEQKLVSVVCEEVADLT